MAEPQALVDGDGRTVCRCVVADSMFARLRGLLARPAPEPGMGMLLPRTSSVHTFFLGYPIDVVFLDRKLCVRAVAPAVRPFRIAARRGFGSVLELAAGEAQRLGLVPGLQLRRVAQPESSPSPSA